MSERDASAKPDPEAVIGTDHKYMGPNGVKAKRYAEGKQHMIFIGPTGTAKTQAAIAVNEELGDVKTSLEQEHPRLTLKPLTDIFFSFFI